MSKVIKTKTLLFPTWGFEFFMLFCFVLSFSFKKIGWPSAINSHKTDASQVVCGAFSAALLPSVLLLNSKAGEETQNTK